MIQIRPGRSWRHNPSYASELSRLGDADVHAFDGARILDVLGIEVDGVDIAAGVGEAPICSMIDELIQAALQLARGSPAAQATVGPGPTQMVLEPRGDDVLMTLLSLRQPARVLAGGLLVDAMRLRSAALNAAQRVLADLLDLGPALRGSPWVRRITRDLRELQRVKTAAPKPWPPEGIKAAGFVARSGRGEMRLEVRVPAASAARISARSLAANAPLAPLLGPGSIALRFTAPSSQPSLSLEAPPYLALRDLLRSAEELVRAFESGEPAFLLRFGTLQLRCDLTRDELRAEGLRDAVHATPLALAEACATAARAFSKRALGLNLGTAKKRQGRDAKAKREAAQAQSDADAPLDALAADATALLKHCRDLRTGDLLRAPESVRAPPLPLPAPAAEKTTLPGSVRRIVHRLGFEISVGPIGESGLHIFPQANAAVMQGAAGLFAIDLQTSARLWHVPSVQPTPWSIARVGERAGSAAGELFALRDDALLRIDPANGETRFRRVIRGAGARIFSLPGGCAVSLASGGLAFVRDGGDLTFRVRLSEEPVSVLACESPLGTTLGTTLILQLPSGQLLGLDALEGAELWRRRIGVRAGAVQLAGEHALACAQDARGAQRIVSLAVGTGETSWERALPPSPNLTEPGSLVLFGDFCATLAGRGAIACRSSDGQLAFSRELPWASAGSAGRLAAVSSNQPPGAALLLALGPSAAAILLDERGTQRWSRNPISATQTPALPLVQVGPVLLLADGAVELADAESGRTLSKPAIADVDAAALLPDLSVLLHLRDGTLAMMRQATHLSLV